jgi:nitrogen fixation protein FixH
MNPAKPFRFTGWHFLTCMVVFFGIDIAINVGFIVQSVRTFPGEVADDPYEAGIAYDHTLAREAVEARLGWTAALETPLAAPGGEALTARWSDKAGRPLTGLAVTGLLRRPATEQDNVTLRFTEVSAGAYRAIAPVTSGAWDLDLTAANHRGDQRTAERRLIWR